MMDASKFALGTVQLGLDYGVSNAKGRVSEEEAFQILSSAASSGVRVLDTARGYGASEAVIGNYFAKHPEQRNSFRIVTKVSDPDVEGELTGSLASLGVDSVDTLLLHRESDLEGSQGETVWKALERLKALGRVRNIGVSCYSPESLISILDRFPINAVQVPFNIFDRGFGSADLVKRYASSGIEVHVRSVFLQGLLFLTPETCPKKMEFAQPVLKTLLRITRDAGASAAALSLSLALDQPWVSKVVVGVTSKAELTEMFSWKPSKVTPDLDRQLVELRRRSDPRVFDPRQW